MAARTADGIDRRWYVYLIECRDGSIYTGITVDVGARYAAHANGTGARYTRAHPPRTLLGAFEYADRSAASKAEYEVKQLSASAKRALCCGPAAPAVRDSNHARTAALAATGATKGD